MKITTSITLLALLFVLVFAGTLSGAFGVEENLIQNGSIENVALANPAQSGTATAAYQFGSSGYQGTNTFPEAKKGGVSGDVNYATWSSDYELGDMDDYGAGSFGFFTKTARAAKHATVSVFFAPDIYLIRAIENSAVNNIKVVASVWTYDPGWDWGDNLDNVYGKIDYYEKEDFKGYGTDATLDGSSRLIESSNSNGNVKSAPISEQVFSSLSTNGKIRISIGAYEDRGGLGDSRRLYFGISNDSIKITITKGDTSAPTVSLNNDTKTLTFADNGAGIKKIEYSTNGGSSYTTQYEPNANVKNYTWSNVPAGTYTLRMTDNLDNVRTQTITVKPTYAPNIIDESGTAVLNGCTAISGKSMIVIDKAFSVTIASSYVKNGTTKYFIGWQISGKNVTWDKARYGATDSVESTMSQGDTVYGGTTTYFSNLSDTDNDTVTLTAIWIEGDYGSLPSGTSGKWGSLTNPFVIANESHLIALSDIVNGKRLPFNSVTSTTPNKYGLTLDTNATDITYSDCYFIVTTNITASSFTRIANDSSHYFNGNFNGQNYTISGLNCGLFGYVSGGTFKDLTLKGSVTNGTSNYYGGLIGYGLNITVSNVTSELTISTSSSYVGGLIGFCQNATITDCTNNASITGVNYVGGIAGYANQSIFSNDSNLAGFTVQGTSFVGGIVGAMQNSSRVENSPNSANVNAQTCVGGIVGFISSNGTVSGSNNSGKITASGSSNDSRIRIGGIVGAIDGSGQIENCDNENEVNVSGGTYGVGGILGYHSGSADNAVTISNCDNKGTVVGRSETGGIVGYTDYATISDCNNTKAVSGLDNVGGVVGKICAGSVANCSNVGKVSGNNYIGGVIGGAIGVGNNKDTNITVSKCTNSATVTSSSSKAAAGIVGGLIESTTIRITNCENSGTVSAGNANGVAGILGHTNADSCNNVINVSNCKNTGTVTGSRNAGGIGGRIETTRTTSTSASLIFRNCYNSGNISATPNGTVGGIVGYLYANGGSSADIAVVLYCFNQGTISGKDNIGGIVGNPNQTANKVAVRIGYSYTTYGQVAGTSNATVDATAYTIAKGTKEPKYGNGGSYLLFDGDTTVFDYPLVDGAQTTWENIVTQNINGFHLTTNVAAGDYYVSLNDVGVDGALLTPVNFTSVGSSSFVVEAEYSAEQGNIYVDTADIVLVSKTVTYDKQAHTIDAPTLPDDYTFSTLYFTNADAFTDGKGTASRTDVDDNPYCTETKVFIGNTVVGRMADKNYGTLTIIKLGLRFENTWIDNLCANDIDRTGQNCFVYNAKLQGLSISGVRIFGVDKDGKTVSVPKESIYSISYTEPDQNGEGYVYKTAGTYFRRYTLNNNNYYFVDYADGIVEYKWTIAKNQLTIRNAWTSDAVGNATDVYNFTFNGSAQGILSFKVFAQVDTTGVRHGVSAGEVYSIAYSANSAVAVGNYHATLTLLDTDNYEIVDSMVESYVATIPGIGSTDKIIDRKGVSVTTNAITYNWKINQFDIESAFNAANPQVWFGAGENMLVSNQSKVKTEKVGNVEYSYYYLQKSKDVTPQILVYENSDYNKQNFVLYIKYTTYVNGTAQTSLAKLVIGTDYEIADLTTAGDKHVADATVTASGENNFKGTISKYYVVLNSDFGGNINQANWGSASNPYVIENPVQMLRLSQIVNGGVAWNSINSTNTNIALAQNTNAVSTDRDYRNAYFVLSESYTGTLAQTVSGTVGFEPIGSAAYPFKAASFAREGTTNVTIEYSYSNALREYAGFFGYIDGTYIHGIDFVGVGTVSASNYLGGIVGYANGGKIEDCTFRVRATIGQQELKGGSYVGGLVGYANGTTIIHNSDTNDYGKLMQASVSGVNYVGGIVGEWIVTNANQINGDSYVLSYANDFTVTGSGSYAGGIAGKLDASGCTTDLTYLGLYTNGKAVTGSDNVMDVVGVNYVGALFGAFIGNGYHYDADNSGVRSVILVKSLDDIRANVIADGDGVGYVMGGLIGYAEKVGILIGCDWTSETMSATNGNTIAKTGVYVNAKGVTSFVGGLVGVLGENATIESVKQEVAVVGGTATISGGQYSVVNKIAINGKDFVGGLIGYIASSAGSYFGTTGTILGNSIKFYNEAAVSGANYVGGIVGGLGIVDGYASFIGSDSDDVLKNLLSATLNSKQSILGYSTLESDPYTQNPFGKLINVANVTGSGNYVGGIFGYVGDRVSLTLENGPISTAMNAGELDTPYGYLNVYNGNSGLTGGSAITVKGSQYVGGIAGWLDNQAHDLTFVVNRSYVNGTTYAGGLVGYMRAGTITSSIAVAPDDVTASTNTYIGTTYIGGLVGYVDHGTISGSMSTGFSFVSVNANNGGIIGNGISPTIENTWTIYVAKDATYSTVSTNGRGKYLLLDSRIVMSTGESVPNLTRIAEMIGLYTYQATSGILDVSVNVPPTESNSLKNKQLVFYNASGNDEVTNNTFEKFENNNNVLNMQLSIADADNMIVSLYDVVFENIANCKDTDEAVQKANALKGYREPSVSKNYVADVLLAQYNSDGRITKLTANLYYKIGTKLVVIGAYQENGETVYPGYDESFTPGSKESPYIINTQEEWNEFAYSVYTGAKSYSGQYVKLTTDVVVDKTSHKDTNGNILNFGSSADVPANGSAAPSNIGYNFAGDISLDNANHSFKGTFDGNGHKITINYTSGGYYRVSVFPNASGATFRNLTVAGKIQAASQMNGANGISASAAYDIAGFVGKAFGTLSFINCTNEANIIGLRNVAGIVGYNSTGATITLTGCVNTGKIVSLQGMYTISGGFNDTYKYYDDLSKTGVGVDNISFIFGTGGIIGSYVGNLTIESCRNAGDIIGGHNVGGIIGRHEGSSSNSTATLTINNCANTGYILANSGYWGEDEGRIGGAASEGVRQHVFGYAGGLVGITGQYSILKMYGSYNTGEVVTYSNIVGGLVGGVGAMYQPSGKNAVKTGGRSTIAYCYNVGEVKAGGTFPKRTQNWGGGRENFGGTVVGGIAGLVGDIQISQSYNAGNIWQYGIVAYSGSWQVRAGGIVGQSQPTSNGYVLFDNLYNVGSIYVRCINTYVVTVILGNQQLYEEARYGAAISGYCDTSDAAKRIHSADCYSIDNCVSSKIAKDISGDNPYTAYKNGTNEWYGETCDEYYTNSGIAGIGESNPDLIETGKVYDTYDKLTAVINSSGNLSMTGQSFAFGQSITALDYNYNSASDYSYLYTVNSVTNDSSETGTTWTNVSSFGWKSYPDSWLYVYGCLPQLSMFALDTENGLSMRSVGYGKDIYGAYNDDAVAAGSQQYPYIIKDGIDLLGFQALVDCGYDFSGKYVVFANEENNLNKTVTKVINMPTTNTKQGSSTTDFKSSSAENRAYNQVGKSYHLFALGAVCNGARKSDASYVGTDYTNWKNSNFYYKQNDATMTKGAAFSDVNFLPVGRKGGSNIFKGNISGKQADGTNTEVANLRIVSSGSDYAFAGLFARVESANISYISVSGSMKAYGTYVAGHSIVGGIAADTSGNTVIDHCNAGTTSRSLTLEAHGKNDTYYSGTVDQLHTYAGGIVGIANTSFYTGSQHEYRAGTTSVIKNCNTLNATVKSAKNNIGGLVGYASSTSLDGKQNAAGKNNKIEITDNVVTSANLSAFTASGTGNSDIGTKVGGVLGYSDEYIAVVISGCTVGTDSTTASVTITGENAIGGIAGAMPNAINEIKDCAVKASTLIQRGNSWGVVENVSDKSAGDGGDHGTAIGGIVGYTYHNSAENAVTTTLSGNISFAGKINIDYPTQDGAVRNVGGIFGDMASGASFATGAVINVTGTISVKDTIKTDNQNADNSGVRNIGGVAGRTRDVAFSGDFTVSANIVIPNAYNVGGFIGRNRGEVNILADNTVIKIGGTLEGSHGVGGFIGNNDADNGAILYIGANEYRRTRYEKPLSIEISQGATISASGDNVGGIVGNNASVDGTGEGSIQIVKGSITNNGTVKGANAVGGIIGNNNAGLVTGGGTGSDAVKKLTIVNGGAVSGNNYVGGVIGKLNRGTIAGTFVNNGDVTGKLFVGGSIGYVAFDAVITVAGGVATEFKNGAKEDAYTASGDALTADGDTVAQGVGSVSGEAYVGGSIGILLGKITGTAEAKVIFTSSGKVNATAAAGYLGGSIGALAGEVSYTQFISSGDNMSDIDAITAVGGSVGFIGAPTPLLKANCNKEYAIDLSDVKITVVDSHFESNGNVKLTGSSAQIAEAKKNDDDSEKGEFEWGGVGGAIGVIAGVSNGFNGGDDWKNNTYYAEGNVTAPGIYNVGGIVGFIRANGIKINNLLAYDITVDGATNVGGIIGSTIGTGTVIEYAFSISSTDGTGLFTASDVGGQAGGIIGKAADDTDASTSYWVKGYKNAELAGTDASRLKDTLGLYTAITEKIQNSDGTYTTVIFTKELVGTTAEDGSAVTENAVYPTPYDYIDAVGAHTVNGETVTLEATLETDETGAITKRDWKWYFTNYYTNAEFANDTWVLKKPNWKAYSTGTEQTGWYFVYANDTVTDDIVGTVDAAHKSATAANLNDKDFWKRIANAYTNEERKNGDDVREIYSTIVSSIDADNTVSGGGLLLENNLYATATAANENKSGYYLYIASSGTSRPTAIHGTNDDKFYIQINTAIDKTTIAKNVAVYYRSFAMGSALTYNGYSRFAPISLQKDIPAEPGITDGKTDASKKNTYAYSTTLVGDEKAITVKSYKSNVFVYYYDDTGTAYKVGGIKEGQWKIKQRVLTMSTEGTTSATYGDDNIATTVYIDNIVSEDINELEFVLSVTDSENVTIKWGVRDWASNGVSIALVSSDASKSLSGTDANFNVGEIDKTTYKLKFTVKFTNAKEYSLSVALADNALAKNYSLSNAEKDIEVKRKELTITGPVGGGDSDGGKAEVTYDGNAHGATWTVNGIVNKQGYNDTLTSVLSVFNPQFVARIRKDPNKEEYLAPESFPLVQKGAATVNNRTIEFGYSDNTNTILFSGAIDAGNYYLAFTNCDDNSSNPSNYYIKYSGKEDYSPNRPKSNSFTISTNMLTVTWTSASASHVYDPNKKGVLEAKVVAKDAINDFKAFVEKYFVTSWTSSLKGTNIAISAQSDNKTATITFTTDVNAGSYTANIKVNDRTDQDIINCGCDMKDPSKTYRIDKKTITLSFKDDNANTVGTYIYNTAVQGLKTISISGLYSDETIEYDIAISSNDAKVQYKGKSYSKLKNSGSADLSGRDWINAGTYKVTLTLRTDTASNNYQLVQNNTSRVATAQWTIEQKEIKLNSVSMSNVTYDAQQHKPSFNLTIDSSGSSSSGAYKWKNDTITINYKSGSSVAQAFVNAGKYNVSVAADAITATRDNVDTTANYIVDSASANAISFEIYAREITLVWKTDVTSFVYSGNAQGLTVSGATSTGMTHKVSNSTLDSVTIEGCGDDTITVALSGKQTNAGSNYKMTYVSHTANGTNFGEQSNGNNYTFADAEKVSAPYEIMPSKLTIKSVGGSTTKVYDATTSVTDISTIAFVVESTNGGANGSTGYFTFTGLYDNKNVGTGKTVTLTFTFNKPNGNYEFDGDNVKEITTGVITQAELKVVLDKLRSGKATRAFNGNTTYGGNGVVNGVNGNRSNIYRVGEGFSVSGFKSSSDIVAIVANYFETGKDRSEFDSYVNNVYKDVDAYKKDNSHVFYKALKFSMSGDDANNYQFIVVDKENNKYSDTIGTNDNNGKVQSVIVYDSRDEANKNGRASSTSDITIEITVKSIRVEYSNTSQSYATEDNKYFTDWADVKGENKDMKATGAEIEVKNGWMYENGVDGKKKEYHGYKVIRGSQGSTLLGATVKTGKGMEFNYRLSNQPTLTIGYFVSSTDFAINSIAKLMIASFYVIASQNSTNPEILKIISSGYKWETVVTNEEYLKDPDKWDEEFAKLEEKGYSVFLTTEEITDGNMTIPADVWGYYVATESGADSKIPTSFKQTADISGIVTKEDISLLESFFTILKDDGSEEHLTWGVGGEYITNFAKPSVGNVLTALGSVFVSTADGFGGTYNGNGYVIEYLNIFGYAGAEQNVGMFDKIGNGSVSGLHLRNVTISANGGNVGGIAGEILAGEASNVVSNVSFHGSITVSGIGNVGGLFGKSARNIDKAIVLGTITANGGNVAGVVGSMSGKLSNVISLMQVDASGTVAPIANGGTVDNVFYLANAVWSKDGNGTISFVGGNGTAKSYAELMNGSISGYGANKYYYSAADSTGNAKGVYDVIDDVALTSIDVEQTSNPRQSMRLRDIVDVYLLMYSLSETTATESGIVGAKTYTISATSWLVGSKHGTSKDDAIVIANKQNVALLRQLRFATFILQIDLSTDGLQQTSGAFYGTIYQNEHSIPSDWLATAFANVEKATVTE